MAALHVQKLDGEDVRGMPQLLCGKKERSGLLLRGGPPFHHTGDAPQLFHLQRAQDAKHVHIGVLMKILARRRSVQNYRFEVGSARFVQPLHEIFQQFLHVAHSVVTRPHATLPASRGAASSAAAAAKAPKSSAARKAARAAAEPSTAAPTAAAHASEHRPNPPTAAAPSPAAYASFPRARNREDDPNQKQYPPKANRKRAIATLANRPRWRLARQRDTAIIGDIFRQHPRGCLDGGAVIGLAQKWNHGAPGISCARVIDNRLQAVADFDAVFVLVGCYKKQHTAIVAFAADPKLLVQIHAIVFDAFTVQRFHRDNRDLRASFLLDFIAKRLKPRLGIRGDHAREIRHITGRVNGLGIFCRCDKSGKKKENGKPNWKNVITIHGEATEQQA